MWKIVPFDDAAFDSESKHDGRNRSMDELAATKSAADTPFADSDEDDDADANGETGGGPSRGVSRMGKFRDGSPAEKATDESLPSDSQITGADAASAELTSTGSLDSTGVGGSIFRVALVFVDTAIVSAAELVFTARDECASLGGDDAGVGADKDDALDDDSALGEEDDWFDAGSAVVKHVDDGCSESAARRRDSFSRSLRRLRCDFDRADEDVAADADADETNASAGSIGDKGNAVEQTGKTNGADPS